jgi:two-component system chemotaxis sensor kinase CheA
MSVGEDDDILEDFVVEAGEILEQLFEQLVDLERNPEDWELLNAIFRGFHTVKGGAGFLQIDEMVDCCHITENLFDSLRNGQGRFTADLMDVVLRVLDAIKEQFRQVSLRQPVTPASPELIKQLESLTPGNGLQKDQPLADKQLSSASREPSVGKKPPAQKRKTADKKNLTENKKSSGGKTSGKNRKLSTEKTTAVIGPKAPAQAQASSIGITDAELKVFLDEVDKSRSASQLPVSVATTEDVRDDGISEDEFEGLLDQLYGKGKGPATLSPAAKADNQQQKETTQPLDGNVPVDENPLPNDVKDEVSQEEFEVLLDQLYGRGKGPSSSLNKVSPDTAEQAMPAVSHSRTRSDLLEHVSTAPPEVAELTAPVAATPVAVASPAETTVRVDTQRLDDIMNMVGELVLVRNRLVRLGTDNVDEALSKAVSNLDLITADLQTAMMKVRMQPIRKVFGRFPRVVRDLARHLRKEIVLELEGEDTDLDKNLVEALADPLVHLLRNAADHGIETPAEREASGKAPVGTIKLSAEQEGDHILLTISDDGCGMDPQALRAKAIEKSIVDADAAGRLSDMDALDLIFAPGFSTKAKVSDVSGRGVGMDVVKTKITQLNGSVNIQSQPGKGTHIAIKVPLTLAIMPTLMVTVAAQNFALPLASIHEIFRLNTTVSNRVDGQTCITVRDQVIPLFSLKSWLIKKADSDRALAEDHVVIVSIGARHVGLVVDQVVGQEEVVIKPLGRMLQGTPGMAGATITGDGRIALILDLPGLLKHYAGAER